MIFDPLTLEIQTQTQAKSQPIPYTPAPLTREDLEREGVFIPVFDQEMDEICF